MKERPILFTGDMVLAILGGRKAMTRRVAKGMTDPIYYPGTENHCVNYRGKTWWCDSNLGFSDSHLSHACPLGQPGDRLWVRETWRGLPDYDDTFEYRADWSVEEENKYPKLLPWKPSIHMPRKASRITLEITKVMVERLQDISEDDARAEGVEYEDCWTTCRQAFEGLWCKINGSGCRC